MRRIAKAAILVAAPLLMAAIWMDEQPSYKPYGAPAPPPPVGSVPASGKESVSPGTMRQNPVAPTPASQAEGNALFNINCAMCHGPASAERGPVGKKLSPPPPGLDQATVQVLSDTFIFNAITNGFGRMPPFRDKLLPRERWTIVIYLRTRK